MEWRLEKLRLAGAAPPGWAAEALVRDDLRLVGTVGGGVNPGIRPQRAKTSHDWRGAGECDEISRWNVKLEMGRGFGTPPENGPTVPGAEAARFRRTSQSFSSGRGISAAPEKPGKFMLFI